MFSHKSLTLQHQVATSNSISGHHNSLTISSCKGSAVVLKGDYNLTTISNSSLSLSLFGNNNVVRCFNSNLTVSLVGNNNKVFCTESVVQIANMTGSGNEVIDTYRQIMQERQMQQERQQLVQDEERRLEREDEEGVSLIDPLPEQSIDGRSNIAIQHSAVIPQIHSLLQSIHQPMQLIQIIQPVQSVQPVQPVQPIQQVVEPAPADPQPRIQENSSVRQETKCVGFNRFLQFFGCMSSGHTRRRNNLRPVPPPAPIVNQLVPVPVPQPQVAPRRRRVQPKPSMQGLSQQQLKQLVSTLVSCESSGPCLICLVDIQKDSLQTYLPCFHHFHSVCIKRWLSKNALCPLCQTNLKPLI